MIPESVKAILWSYDTSKIDLKRDKKTIIAQVLNFGSEVSTNWLFTTYEKDEVSRIAATIPASAWNKKSLALWSLVLNINPPANRQLL